MGNLASRLTHVAFFWKIRQHWRHCICRNAFLHLQEHWSLWNGVRRWFTHWVTGICPIFTKPCHKGPKSSIPRCSATAVPLFSWPTPSLVHQASFLCIQDLPIYPKLKWWSPFWNASNSQVTRKGYNQTNGADFSNRACFAHPSPWLTCWQQYLRLHT